MRPLRCDSFRMRDAGRAKHTPYFEDLVKKKKSLQNVSWRCFMLITSWSNSIGIYWVRWNTLLKLVLPVSFHLFWCGYCKSFSLHCSPTKLPHASPAYLLPSVWEMLHFAVRWRPSSPLGHVFWTTPSPCVRALENNKQDIQPPLYVCVLSSSVLSNSFYSMDCNPPDPYVHGIL